MHPLLRGLRINQQDHKFSYISQRLSLVTQTHPSEQKVHGAGVLGAETQRRKSNISALLAVSRTTEASFPFFPLHCYSLQKQNKREINRSSPRQTKPFHKQLSSWPVRFHGSVIDTHCVERARHQWLGESQTAQCCTPVQDQLSHRRAKGTLAVQAFHTSLRTDTKFSMKQKENRTIHELKHINKSVTPNPQPMH